MDESLKMICLREHPELVGRAAAWFHSVWGIPEEAYLESMEECVKGLSAVPQWYAVTENGEFIAGIGVIENDFHPRRDLAPNVCAVYVDKAHRCMGIAGKMLNFVCADLHKKGIGTLYLLTDHDSFYERYGWEFLCEVTGDGETQPSRMYIHRM